LTYRRLRQIYFSRRAAYAETLRHRRNHLQMPEAGDFVHGDCGYYNQNESGAANFELARDGAAHTLKSFQDERASRVERAAITGI
jgi:hypothetical protein